MTASAFSLSEESAQKTSSALPAIETLVDPERLACAQELEARAAVSDSEAARSATRLLPCMKDCPEMMNRLANLTAYRIKTEFVKGFLCKGYKLFNQIFKND